MQAPPPPSPFSLQAQVGTIAQFALFLDRQDPVDQRFSELDARCLPEHRENIPHRISACIEVGGGFVGHLTDKCCRRARDDYALISGDVLVDTIVVDAADDYAEAELDEGADDGRTAF